jgi:serine/threonine protein kinase
VDYRADIYGLGCTLYFMLTGQPPFPDGTPIEKLIKHQIDPPPPLQALRREIPAEVAAVVTRMMAKRPGERIQTAEEVADALALLSVYPHGSQPVRIRVRRPPATVVPDTLSPSEDATAPPAELAGVEDDEPRRRPSGRTPHPGGASALHAPTEGDPALDGFEDGSGEHAAHRKSGQSGAWPWIIAAVAVLFALVVVVYVLITLSSKKQAPPAPRRAGVMAPGDAAGPPSRWAATSPWSGS